MTDTTERELSTCFRHVLSTPSLGAKFQNKLKRLAFQPYS